LALAARGLFWLCSWRCFLAFAEKGSVRPKIGLIDSVQQIQWLRFGLLLQCRGLAQGLGPKPAA
jgi:hypothetical protein